MSEVYKFLGNISAVEGWASVALRCDVCMVEWVGCYDQATCPRCGNHDAWDALMEARGYYKSAIIQSPGPASTGKSAD